MNLDGFSLEEDQALKIKDKRKPNPDIEYAQQRGGNIISYFLENYTSNYFPLQIEEMSNYLIQRRIYPNLFHTDEISIIRLCYFFNLFGTWMRVFEFSSTAVDVRKIPVLNTPHLEQRSEALTNYP